jgi:WD40 repeat protein
VTGEQPPKYWAFISYSHRDRKWAEWLHRRMETYRVPGKLVGEGVPARAFPVFRDRDELSSASDLTGKVVSALGDSRTLVVLCSPDAARSRWVNEEIRQFQQLGGADRTFAFIIAGEPVGGECFPPALTELRAEPIAADARDGGDGRKNAFLKLMAGVLNVGYDQLRRRDYERQLRVRTIWTGLLLVLAGVLAGLTLYANRQRLVAIERQKIAVSRQLSAEALSQMGTRLDRSLLLAIEGHRVAPTAEAHGSLLRLLQAAPYLVTFLHGGEAPVTALAISPDGKTIASGDGTGALRLWSMEGRPLAPGPVYRHQLMKNNEEEVRVITFSPDGKLVASGSANGTLRFADVASHAPRFVESQFGGTINSLAFTPDSRQVLVDDVSLTAIDPAADKVLEPQFASLAMPNVAALSPDGTTVAASFDTAINLYDYPSRKVIGTIPQEERADGLTFSPDGLLLAETVRQGMIRLLDVKARAAIGQPVRGYGYVLALAFAFTSNRSELATIWSDGTLRRYAIPAMTPSSEPLSFGEISSAAFGPGLDTVVTGHRDGTVRLHRMSAEHHPLGTGLHSAYGLNDVAFSPDGKTIAVASESGIALWDVASRTKTRDLGYDHVMSVAFTGDGRTLASSANEGVDFWEVRSGNRTHVPSAEPEPYNWRIALTPDGSLAAFSGHSLTVWDVQAKKVAATPAMGKGSVRGVAISGDGKLLAASSQSGAIHFFELPSAKPSGAPIAFGTEAWALAFTPDGKSLLAGGDNGSLVVFDVKTRRAVGNPVPGHPGRIDRLAFSPDGSLLVSTGVRNTALLFAWPARQPLGGPLFRDSEYGSIGGAAFSTDGKLLALVGAGQMLWLLDGNVDAWIARACAIANRNLTRGEWARSLPDEPYRETCTARPLAR